jgi:hypothetical protein
MKTRWIQGAGLAFLASLLLASIPALAAAPAAKPDPAMEAAMAEMEKLAAPGPAHEKLKAFEGKWKAVQKAWLGPGEPTVNQGISENRMILGGRYLEQRYKGTFGGKPYEGYGLTGYDNKKSMYTTMWIDTWATAAMTGEGTMDGNQDLVVKSTADGPDGKPAEYRMVTHRADANRHVFSMFMTSNGQEQLMMEITYTKM